MPQFKYEGKSASGQIVEGVLEARSAEELTAFLRRQRIVVTKIKKKPKAMGMTIGTGVKAVEISRFTRQFAVMIEAGLPLVQCLDILAEQSENPVLASTIGKVRDTVASGTTLAAALAKHKKIFSELYINMIEAGEMGGALESILRRLADYQEKADRLARKVKGALIYPAMMLIMTIGMTFVMLTFIIPIFADMFNELGGTLPAPTRFVMMISKLLVSNLVFIFIGVAVLVGAYVFFNSRKASRFYIDMAKLQMPMIGSLLRKTAVARFCRTLGTLLRSGVNLIDALNITAKTAGNLVLTRAIHKSMVSISEGETITAPLGESKVFPTMVIQMIGVGEKTGNMDEMLEKIAEFYDEEVDAAVSSLTAMIEPVVIVVMGTVIGGMLIAMYLPMFDIIGQIK